jgi:hypothetical protein
MKQKYELSKVSLFTNRLNTMCIEMEIEDFYEWQKGALIQQVLPYLSPSEREFLMTGSTDDEWDEIFKERE